MKPFKLPRKLDRSVIAMGGDLKCHPALADGDEVNFLEEIGDLAAPENQDALEEMIERHSARAVVCDRHPDYFSTTLSLRLAAERGLPLIQVQHHRAHVAAVCMERGLFDEKVVGLAFDGTGFGDDGNVWGGEFFTGSLAEGFKRAAHFAPLPLPGGDAAVRQPWRMVLALLLERGVSQNVIDQWLARHRIPLADPALFKKALRTGLPVGRSTALGRWFDAASALLGVCTEAKFEAQPAIELQQAAEKHFSEGAAKQWAFEIKTGDPSIIDFPELEQIAKSPPEQIPQLAAGFHVAAAQATAEVAGRLAAGAGAKTVVASGGCFLNSLFDRLLEKQISGLGLRYVKPKILPPGDQALALGQIGLVLPGSKY